MRVMQEWLSELPMMQQTVLLTALRGPDGLPKYHASKYLLRWYRRCFLISSMEGCSLDDPYDMRGGSFTGPSVKRREPEPFRGVLLTDSYLATGSLRDGEEHSPNEGARRWRGSWQEAMDDWVSAYIRGLDEVPHHFQLHFMHGVEILGYKHPDRDIRAWWHTVYVRLVHDMHLWPETEQQLDERLGDDRSGWLRRADPATVT